MKTDTKQQIKSLLAENTTLSPKELSAKLQISPQALHRHLKALLESKDIIKLGAAPKVRYRLLGIEADLSLSKLSAEELSFIEKNFSELNSSGSLLQGVDAFKAWLLRTKQSKAYQSLARSYIKTCAEAYKHRDKTGLINLLPKVQQALPVCALDYAYCQDFYSLPQFGKTHLGNLITAAKSGQNKPCLLELASIFEKFLKSFIVDRKISTLCWTPHSIPRRLMFLDELKTRFKLDLPEIIAHKVFAGSIPVAQKSLSKLSERIKNAQETIHLEISRPQYENILIIDDALGSGATVNEIACLLYTSPSPRDGLLSRMPSSA